MQQLMVLEFDLSLELYLKVYMICLTVKRKQVDVVLKKT